MIHHFTLRAAGAMPRSLDPRPLRADVPVFDPTDDSHLRAWEATWDFLRMAEIPETRRAIEANIEAEIALLDAIDGDPDREETDAEDSFILPWFARYYDSGPGCPASDCGEEDDPSGQCDEDDINTGHSSFGMYENGPGCPISDPAWFT